jgi:hypothetical protein
VYLKAASEPYGHLLVDNGGIDTAGWNTPLTSPGIVRLMSLAISGNARVSATNWLRVINGNPATFLSLMNSTNLQVAGLIVSNTWVYGNIMDLEIRSQASEVRGQEPVQALVTVFCRPQKTYLLLASANLSDWIPVATNSPSGSFFQYLDTEAPALPQRYFRAVRLEHLFDSLGLSVSRTNRQARLTVSGAQPGHTLVLQASEDLRQWISLSTNTPTIVTNWLVLDTNAPAFHKRFYRAVKR